MIAASPWLAWDDEKELTELVPFLESPKLQLREMFFSYGDEGPEMKKNIDALAAALQSRNDRAVRWSSRSYPEETHNTTVVKSYYDGLRAIFAGYACPRDPKTNLLVGSIGDMKSHFAKLSEQWGAPLALRKQL